MHNHTEVIMIKTIVRYAPRSHIHKFRFLRNEKKTTKVSVCLGCREDCSSHTEKYVGWYKRKRWINCNYTIYPPFNRILTIERAVFYSAVFLLIALLAVGAGASSTLWLISTPASSGSIIIRPQYSQTITFLRERISSCL